MTLEQLQTLIAVVKEGSFRGASKKLSKTQPTLSVALKNLESELGFELLDRSQYRPRLTPKGERFYTKALTVLEEVSDLMGLGAELKGDHEAQIHIAIDSACPLAWLLSELRDFFALHRETQLDLSFGVLQQCQEQVINGDADFAIAPQVFLDERIRSTQLFKMRLLPVASKALFSKKSVSLSELREKRNIIVSTGRRRATTGVPKLKDGRSLLVSNHSIKEELILAGIGWGRVPAFRLQERSFAQKVRVLENPEIGVVELQIELLQRADGKLGPVARELVDHILKLDYKRASGGTS